jgi:hypothetical protein
MEFSRNAVASRAHARALSQNPITQPLTQQTTINSTVARYGGQRIDLATTVAATRSMSLPARPWAGKPRSIRTATRNLFERHR